MEADIDIEYEQLMRLSDRFFEAGDARSALAVNQRLLELDLAHDPSLWPLSAQEEHFQWS